MQRLLRFPLALGVGLAGLSPALAAQGLATELVVSGLASPLWVGAPPDDHDHLYALEQNTGYVRVIENGVLQATPFLDLDDVASKGNERGLLGLAFHPDYQTNGRFFVNYTNLAGNTRVVEYNSGGNPLVADPTPVQPILEQSQPFENHNGGNLVFGPDGMLYIGLGDGGSANDPGNRAQTGTTNLGKMLRLDVDLPSPFIPADNPFVGVAGINDEIWALGLRNPWRYSFDRATGDLYIADVGQFQIEEISFQPASSSGGENYGWRCMEGTRCTGLSGCTCDDDALTDPIHEYNHSAGRCSVTGGFVYRGSAIPSLQGTYFFADYCNGDIFSFRYDSTSGTISEFTDRTDELDPPGTRAINRVTSFGEDAAGELYIVDPSGGEIFRVVATCEATNYCTISPTSVGPGAVISSSGSASIAANDFGLVASFAVPSEFGLFFYGPDQIDVPFGDGRLCVGAGGVGLFRLNPPQMVSIFGDIFRPVDFTVPPAGAGAGQIFPGSDWNFQFWFRDPTGPGGSGFNTSDGLNVVFCP